MGTHVSNVIRGLIDLGELPLSIRVLNNFGVFRSGDVLKWSNCLKCYVDSSGEWCLWANTVRGGWGVFFDESTNDVSKQMELAV